MGYTDWSPQSKLFFSLEGVDINDDDALAAFAQDVWEQATAAGSDGAIGKRVTVGRAD